MRIATVLGNRPHFIKHALLSKRLRREHEEVIIHTGQHYDDEMSDSFFRELSLPQPDVKLGVGSGHPFWQVGEMVREVGSWLNAIRPRPDLALVHGDAHSALAGALAASLLKLPVAHVEAGRRTGMREIPEDVNEVLIDHVSELRFAPTVRCTVSLRHEGLDSVLTGDVLYDNYLHYSGKAPMAIKGYIFATIHREANTDNERNSEEIAHALGQLNQEVVFPVHPRTRRAWWASQAHRAVAFDGSKVKVCAPMGYLDTLAHIIGADLVITDSGGVQREAYFAGVPCVYIGNTSCWLEVVGNGSTVVGADAEEIVHTANVIMASTTIGRKKEGGVFGEGDAVEKIAKAIKEWEEK